MRCRQWQTVRPVDTGGCTIPLSISPLHFNRIALSAGTGSRPGPEAFNWYVKQGVSPNLLLLSNALAQAGPWAGQDLAVDLTWLKAALGKKIAGIDWGRAAEVVAPFLRAAEQESLRLWSDRFFNNRVARLAID